MKDKEELLLEKAGEEGNADAKYELGKRYYNNQDYVQAVEWYRKAAKEDMFEAQFRLRECLASVNYRKAIWQDIAMTSKIKVEVSTSGEEAFIDNCPGSHAWRSLHFCVEVDVFDKEANYIINKLESYPDGIPSEIIEKDSNNAIAEVLDAIICEKSHEESKDFFNYFILYDCKYKIISCIPI